MRGWSHGTSKQVFPGGSGAIGADGLRAPVSSYRLKNGTVRRGLQRSLPPCNGGAGVSPPYHYQMPGGHTIVADDGTFSSPPLGEDESWSHTFNAVGDHGYSIEQHPSAKGTVTVE